MATNTNSKVGKRYLPWMEKSVSRIRQDMRSWNMALNAYNNVDSPTSWRLQMLYKDVDLDDTVTSQKNNRQNQVHSANFQLTNAAGEIDEDQTNLLKKHPLYRFFNNAILDKLYYGNSLVELSWKKNNGLMELTGHLVPRYNVMPKYGIFYPDYSDISRKIYYRDLPEFGTYLLEFDNDGDIGLYNKLVPAALFTRFAESCWSELCEIYGIPPRVLKTNTSDTTALNRADKMMKDMGSAAYFIIDETESFEFAKGVSTNGDVYKNLLIHMRNKICSVISGGIIAQDTENGSRSKDQVAFEMLWLLVQSDMEMVEQAWNQTIIPALVKHGVLKEGLTFQFDQAEDLDQLWKFVQGLQNTYEIDPEWIKEKFGVEVTGIRQGGFSGVETLSVDREDDPDFFREALQGRAVSCCGTHHTHLKLPANAPNANSLIEQVIKAEGQLLFDADMASSTADILLTGFNRALKGNKIKLDARVEYGIDDPHLLTAFELNLFRFSTGKTLAEVQALNDAFRRSANLTEFRRRAEQIGETFNVNWLRTEFDTSVLVGQSTVNYYELKRDADLFPFWQYRTVGDAAVRLEHAEIDGLILRHDDPRWAKIFPPNGWNCRCTVIALRASDVANTNLGTEQARADAYFASDDYERNISQGFGGNRALTGEVFTANQQYITGKNLTTTRKAINELTHSVYDLADTITSMKGGKGALPTYNESTQAFVGSLDTLNGRPTLYDYNSRPLDFPPAGPGKAELLLAGADTLKSPSELWISVLANAYKLHYIKYYEGKAMLVTASMENNLLSISKIAIATEKALEKVRKGIYVRP
ncbi:phage portal protein family protein [Peijinzhouia sedimentorum]